MMSFQFIITLSEALTSLLCIILISMILAIVFKAAHFWTSRTELTSISRKAVLITGCDSGIGLELAKYLYEKTNFTIICGFLNKVSSDGFKQLTEIAADKGDSSRLVACELDITSESNIKEMKIFLDEMLSNERLICLHAIVNNAGTLTYGELDWLTTEQIIDQINVNLIGTIQLTRALLPLIIQSGGRFINVSSVNDTTVFPGLSIYSATKSALSAFSRGLGYELRKFNAHVITFRLGDFARLTDIMKLHSSKRDNMWDNMNDEKRKLYGDYFEKFNNHLLDNYGMTSPRSFHDSSLFDDFRFALLSKNPPNTITCAPLTFRIFYFIMELLPVYLQYSLLDFLFQFGFKWKHS